MRHAKSRSLWQARVAEYESSGLTMRAWCERTGFRNGQLRYWLKKARDARKGQSQSWACVDLVDDDISRQPCPSATPGPGVTIRVGAATIEVHPGFDRMLLSEVLHVVLVVSKAEGVATC